MLTINNIITLAKTSLELIRCLKLIIHTQWMISNLSRIRIIISSHWINCSRLVRVRFFRTSIRYKTRSSISRLEDRNSIDHREVSCLITIWRQGAGTARYLGIWERYLQMTIMAKNFSLSLTIGSHIRRKVLWGVWLVWSLPRKYMVRWCSEVITSFVVWKARAEKVANRGALVVIGHRGW